MAQTTPKEDVFAKGLSFREIYLESFRWMLLARILDDKMASLYRTGKIVGGVYLSRGQEALSAATGVLLQKGDIFAPLIRDTAGRLAFGEPVTDSIRTYFGSALGPMRGRDGNVHRGRLQDGLVPMLSHLGSVPSLINGMLMARRFRDVRGVVGATCIGDGGTSTGAFHEAMNQAAVEKLPLVMVVADNQYAYSTPTSRQFACKDLVLRAAGYGMDGHGVDGTDLESCLRVLHHAIESARAGGGPQMVVARLLRLCGHGEHDDASYIDSSLRRSALGGDCLKLAESRLLKEQWADAAAVEQWRAEMIRKVEDAVALVQREPGPDPFKENWSALSSKHLAEHFSEVE